MRGHNRIGERRAGWLVLAALLGACGGGGGGDTGVADGGNVNAHKLTGDAGATSDGASAATSDGATAATSDGSTEPGATVVHIHYAAGSQLITVRGSGLPGGWTTDTPTALGANNTWTFTSTTLTAVTEWKPLLGSTWSLGANYHVSPGQTIDVYPHFTMTKGTVSQLTPAFNSTNLGGARTVWVYLPPGYLENSAARMPVIYMQDGQNLFNAALSFTGVEWGVDETFDGAAAGGKCPDSKLCQSDGDCGGGARCDSFREAIVIAPENGGANRIYEYTPTMDPMYTPSGGADHYLDYLTAELKPRIDAAFRTLPGPADTGIMGSSLGGLLSAYAGVKRPSVFGLNGIMSPSTWWNGTVIISMVSGMAATPERPLRVYVNSGDSGDSNDDVVNTTALAAAYTRLGYQPNLNFLHIVAPGQQHNEVYWAMRLPGALNFILGPRER